MSGLCYYQHATLSVVFTSSFCFLLRFWFDGFEADMLRFFQLAQVAANFSAIGNFFCLRIEVVNGDKLTDRASVFDQRQNFAANRILLGVAQASAQEHKVSGFGAVP